MRTLPPTIALALLLSVSGCRTAKDAHCCPNTPAANTPPRVKTYSSLDRDVDSTAAVPAGMIRFLEADLSQVLAVYQELSARTLIRSPQVPNAIKITVENSTNLNRTEALQMLDTALAAHQIVMIYLGSQYVKVVPAATAPSEAGPVFEGPWRQLPESSTFVTYIAKLNRLRTEDAVAIAMPFAKLPNSIMGARGSDVIFLRDYSANVRRMMEALEKTEAGLRPANP